MRVARYFMSGSDIAWYTFAISGVFFVKIGQMPFSDFNPYSSTRESESGYKSPTSMEDNYLS